MEIEFEIDHIGIAVTDLEAEVQRYCGDFGYPLACREELVDRGIKLAFVTSPSGPAIELMAELGPNGSLAKFIQNRGPGLHHICYRVAVIESAVKYFIDKGYQPIDKAPRHGARGSLVFFFHPKSVGGVLTELCSYPAGQK